MNQSSLLFLEQMFSGIQWRNLSILIVNQTQSNNLIISDFENIRVINSFEIGLAKSRNLAIQNSIGSILVLTDDDVIFENNFIETIHNAYIENENAAMIAFSVKNEKGQLFKKYSKNIKYKLNYFDIYNIMSIEITINRNNFDFKKLQFDENFGLGAAFSFAEEAVLLSDIKKQKKEMLFIPKVIVSHDSISTIDKINFEKQYFILGAVYSRIHNNLFWIWVFVKIAFDLKQSKIKINQIPTLIKSAIKGRSYFFKINCK